MKPKRLKDRERCLQVVPKDSQQGFFRGATAFKIKQLAGCWAHFWNLPIFCSQQYLDEYSKARSDLTPSSKTGVKLDSPWGEKSHHGIMQNWQGLQRGFEKASEEMPAFPHLQYWHLQSTLNHVWGALGTCSSQSTARHFQGIGADQLALLELTAEDSKCNTQGEGCNVKLTAREGRWKDDGEHPNTDMLVKYLQCSSHSHLEGEKKGSYPLFVEKTIPFLLEGGGKKNSHLWSAISFADFGCTELSFWR